MRTNTFNMIRQLVYDNSGIYLSEGKVPLVSARLQKRLRMLGLGSYEDYVDVLRNDAAGEELVEFLNVISTNTTYFFREPVHFKYYAEILRALMRREQRRIRVWCAASSTGEEPYTLAMCYMEELRPGDVFDFRILATDISTAVLDTARRGVYKKDKLTDVPGNIRFKYFTRGERNGDDFTVTDSLRPLISYKRLNLSCTPYPMQGPLDIIFCRNVMIYFDLATKQKLIDEAYRLLRPGGYFFVGHSESISGIKNDFELNKPALYRKR